jgi:hypothetical protein
MPKFNYSDIVCLKPTVSAWRDVPGFRKSDPRIGERAWIYSISEIESRQPFASGTIYGIEFEDGDAIEIHEDDLELIQAAV